MIVENDQSTVHTRVCKTLEGEKIMKSIIQLSLSMLYSILPKRIIKDIQFTGSLTGGEATVIKVGSKIICSDLDIVVSVGFPHYVIIKMKHLLPKLARYINSYLSAKSFNTHVNFSLTSPLIALSLCPLKHSHIYDYEFTTNISIIKKETSRLEASARTPTKADALQLIFTICADYVFLDSMFICSIEKIYWLTKRYLTLLYAMLIFEGKPSRSYEKRLHLALKSPHIMKLFSVDGLNYLKKFTEFKLTGDISHIFKVLKGTNSEHLVDELKKLLDAQIKIILLYQLNENHKARYAFKRSIVNKVPMFQNNHELLKALKHYFDKNSKSIVKSLIYSIQFILYSFFTKRFYLVPLGVRFLTLRHSLRVNANYLIGLSFLFRTGVVESKSYMEYMLRDLHLQMKDIENIWQIANDLGYS